MNLRTDKAKDGAPLIVWRKDQKEIALSSVHAPRKEAKRIVSHQEKKDSCDGAILFGAGHVALIEELIKMEFPFLMIIDIEEKILRLSQSLVVSRESKKKHLLVFFKGRSSDQKNFDNPSF